MNLFVFPQSASDTGGYNIVVKSDYFKLLSESDAHKVVWYTTTKENEYFKNDHIIILRPAKITVGRIINVLRNRPSTELPPKALSWVKNFDFHRIFCGDTVLYRALRANFPENHIDVRFHNCFHRIGQRIKREGLSIDLKYQQLISSFSRLELEIFEDENCTPIFLCSEDETHYRAITKRTNGTIWPVSVDQKLRKRNMEMKEYGPIKYLVYFGSLDTHKRKSVLYFIETIFPKVKARFPFIELHLFGYGTDSLALSQNDVFCHGWYDGEEFPYINDGLYLNPDLTGGGVKIKVKSYLEKGIRFITTPYGLEGYGPENTNQQDSWSFPIEEWAGQIIKIIDSSSK